MAQRTITVCDRCGRDCVPSEGRKHYVLMPTNKPNDMKDICDDCAFALAQSLLKHVSAVDAVRMPYVFSLSDWLRRTTP